MRKRIVLKGGRVFEGDVVIDGKDIVDLVWTEEERGHRINIQAAIPRAAIEREEDLPEG
jgi:hypothetical protein